MKVKMWFVMLLTSLTVGAQENVFLQGDAPSSENLIMQFNFENVSGVTVTDDLSGVSAKIIGSGEVVEMGPYHVLSLGNGSGFLNMTSAAGKLLYQLDNFTISAYYCVARDASLS
ncbi:MAG: hypothetical protein K6C30_07545, partial [Bacteroidaceae bacterium]|nr:hypothetical protein [Bacteroidaceae bacterium]